MDQITLSHAIEPPVAAPVAERYAKCIAASKRVRWDIDHDVLRGHHLDFSRKFLPDGLSRVHELPFLRPAEVRFISQIQGRTYANMFALVERYIGAVTLQLGRRYWFSDPLALEALVRFTDEELKHQELFRRLEDMAASAMPPGYVFKARGNQVADAVVGRSTWALLGFTLNIELMSLAHYRSSIEPDPGLSELWKDIFLYHWKEESQHAILDELEWRREDGRLTESQRELAVDDLVELIGAMDATLHSQAKADAAYFTLTASRTFRPAEQAAIRDAFLKAYRWQYIVTGIREPRFGEVLKSLVTPAQLERFSRAIAPVVEHAAR